MAWTHYTDRAVLDEDAEILGELRARGGISFGPDSHYFDPDYYGAVGDNIHDDTAAIQAAIDAAVARRRGRVLLRPTFNGYRLTSPLRIPINAVDLTIDGAGALLNPTHNFETISVGDLTTSGNRAENIILQGFTINGAGMTASTNVSQMGLALYSVLGCAIRDVKIYNIPHHAIFALKSAQAGSTFMDNVQLDHTIVRFVGHKGFSFCETAGAGDTLTLIESLFNNLGKKITTDRTGADGGVGLRAARISMVGGQVSLVKNDNGTNGFYRAMYVRAATGCIEGVHFEDNGNKQVDSVDLFLDTDCNGMVVLGTNHSCDTLTSSQYGIKTTSKDNVILGARHAGGATGQLLYIVDVTSAVNPFVANLAIVGSTEPTTGRVKYTVGTDRLAGVVKGGFFSDAWVNVRAFGATGDGSTDDTTAVQAAIDSLPAGGGEVYFPAGIYKVTSSIKFIGANTVTDGTGGGVVLRGNGPFNTKIKGNSLTSAVLKSKDTTVRFFRVSIRDIEIDNTSKNAAGGIGIDMTKVSDSQIHNVRITNVETGIYAKDEAFYNDVFHCMIQTVVTGINLDNGGSTPANEWNIFGGKVLDSTTGILLNGTTNTKVFGTSIETFTTGINVGPTTSTSSTHIIGCRLENAPTSGTGILLASGDSGVCILGCHYVGLTTKIGGTLPSTKTIMTDGRYVPGLVSNSTTGADISISVAQGEVVIGTAGSATSIANFSNGLSGQTIRFVVNSTNYTLRNNASIKTRTGADRVLTNNTMVVLTNVSGVWYEHD